MAENVVLSGEYLGVGIAVTDIDNENLEYFRACGRHELRLQRCTNDGLLRYPPTTACPWCAQPRADWVPVEGRGVVYSYSEITHAIQPQFRDHTPYLLLLVELDTQRGEPTPDEAIRMVGNLVTAEGQPAPPEMVRSVGIGSRLRIVYCDVGEGIAIPQWTLDESADQPETPWRYPQE